MPRIPRALMRLGRELRYRPLPIIGEHVVIETLEDVEHVLRQLVTPWITRDSKWSGCDIAPGLAKYGHLDRWCNVDAAQLDGAMRGISVLRANSLTRGEPDPDPELDAEARAFGAGFLDDLAADLGPCVLKLFLNDGLPLELRLGSNLDSCRAGLAPALLPDYFPRPFIVTDACITNASMIWFVKHFYL